MGCTNNFQIIALYMAWGRDFIILLDGDKAGEKSKKAYIEEFGDYVKPKILSYDDFSKNIGKCAMEDIFSVEERLKISQISNPSLTKYSKIAFNSAIQNAFVCGHILPISKDTIGKFEELLKGLNTHKFN
jgi:hypothetical protein